MRLAEFAKNILSAVTQDVEIYYNERWNKIRISNFCTYMLNSPILEDEKNLTDMFQSVEKVRATGIRKVVVRFNLLGRLTHLNEKASRPIDNLSGTTCSTYCIFGSSEVDNKTEPHVFISSFGILAVYIT